MMYVWVIIRTILAALVAFLAIKSKQQPVVYPKDVVVRAAQAILGSKLTIDEFPLQGFTAIVTGSTSGLGKEIASELYSLGGHVVIASRNETKCGDVIRMIQNEHPDSKGTLEIGVIDISDLCSVKKFVEEFKNTHTDLHYLVNNAGINYLSGSLIDIFSNSTFSSKQGYDLAFATNYMGHFLLTKLLLDLINESSMTLSTKLSRYGTKFHGKILNIASSYHYQSDGHMLRPRFNHSSHEYRIPDAARGDIASFTHKYRSYGNSKLAQVLHMKELQRRINNSGQQVKVLSFCPGWTNTNILPKNYIGKLIARNAFPSKVGIFGAIMSLLDLTIPGGEFVTNYLDIFTHRIPGFRNYIGFTSNMSSHLRDVTIEMTEIVLLLTQSFTFGYHMESSSIESRDETIAMQLCEWTDQELRFQGY